MKKEVTRANTALYIHIPFCTTICGYCDFCKLIYNSSYVDAFLDCLKQEIASYNIKECPSIYIGGGTPTSLSESQLEDLLKFVSPLLKCSGEFTIECNIENTTINKLEILKKYGVNRLSFGVQSFDDQLLQEMNRHHDKDSTFKVINAAKELGFTNLNIDLIYGFKGQSKKDVLNDLETFISLDIPHLSIYSLTIHPHTIFGINNYQEQDEDSNREYYDMILEFLRNHGYARYEVSNFARQGYESKHNQTYWNNDQYIGVGLGAEGYLDNIRYANTKSISDYLLGKTIISKEQEALFDQMEYEIILRLRTLNGIDKEVFIKRYGTYYLEKLQNIIKKEQIAHLLIEEQNSIKCNDEGLMVLDYILQTILIELEK